MASAVVDLHSGHQQPRGTPGGEPCHPHHRSCSSNSSTEDGQRARDHEEGLAEFLVVSRLVRRINLYMWKTAVSYKVPGGRHDLMCGSHVCLRY